MKQLAVAVSLLLCIFLPACSAEKNDEIFYIKLGHNFSVNHPFHACMLNFEKYVETSTNGKVDVVLFPGGVIGDNRSCVELIQGGVLNLMKTDASVLESFDPVFGVFSLPYLFDSETQFDKILSGSIIGDLNTICKKRDHFIILANFAAGTRNFYTKNKPILEPAHLNGLKIRVMESKTQIDMVHHLGGTPTPMPFFEIYTALQQGIIDGAENNPTILSIGKQGEVAKHFSFDEHAIIPDFLLLSTETWKEMPQEARLAVQEAALRCSREYRIQWDKAIARSVEQAKKMGVTFYYPPKQPFKERVLPMYEKARKIPVMAAFLDKIEAAKKAFKEGGDE